jgi:hypothetical protein
MTKTSDVNYSPTTITPNLKSEDPTQLFDPILGSGLRSGVDLNSLSSKKNKYLKRKFGKKLYIDLRDGIHFCDKCLETPTPDSHTTQIK